MKAIWLRVMAIVVALACLLTAAAFGQSVGTISGTVLDTSGAVVPGVAVTAKNQGTGVTRNSLTDAAGRYVLPLLPIGTYTVSASLSGFRTEEKKDLLLE